MTEEKEEQQETKTEEDKETKKEEKQDVCKEEKKPCGDKKDRSFKKLRFVFL